MTTRWTGTGTTPLTPITDLGLCGQSTRGERDDLRVLRDADREEAQPARGRQATSTTPREGHGPYGGTTTPETLIETIERTGYGASLPSDGEHDPDHDVRVLGRRTLVAAVLSLPVIVLAMVPAWQFEGWQWLCLLLSLPVVGWAGWPFHATAARNLVQGSASMDTLISLGSLAAFGWSTYALLFGAAGQIGYTHPFELRLERHGGTASLYLEAAVGITSFLLIGRYVEARAKRRSGPRCVSWSAAAGPGHGAPGRCESVIGAVRCASGHLPGRTGRLRATDGVVCVSGPARSTPPA